MLQSFFLTLMMSCSHRFARLPCFLCALSVWITAVFRFAADFVMSPRHDVCCVSPLLFLSDHNPGSYFIVWHAIIYVFMRFLACTPHSILPNDLRLPGSCHADRGLLVMFSSSVSLLSSSSSLWLLASWSLISSSWFGFSTFLQVFVLPVNMSTKFFRSAVCICLLLLSVTVHGPAPYINQCWCVGASDDFIPIFQRARSAGKLLLVSACCGRQLF